MANESQSTETPIESGELNKEDIIDYLNDDDDEVVEKEDKEEVEDKEDKEEKDDDEEEIEIKDDEESDEDKDEEELKLVTPFKKQEILKKYPNVFKEFPYLEKAYYRDQQYTEMFATPAEAKEAVERVEILNEYEKNLSSGNTEVILKSVKENDPKAFNKIIDNYVQVLAKVDPDAHIHVVGGIIKNLIVSMVREGKATDNPELRKVAQAINRYAFNSDEFIPQQPLSAKNESEDAVEAERKQWLNETFESVRDDLDNKVENVLKSTIMDHIDPKNIMTDYVKKSAVRESLENVKELLANDKSFRKHLDTLWDKAFEAKFNRASVNAIRSAYLSKAKTVLAPVIKKSRNEALRGLGKRVRVDNNQESQPQGKVREQRTSTSSSNRGQKGKVEIPKGVTTLDYLNQD